MFWSSSKKYLQLQKDVLMQLYNFNGGKKWKSKTNPLKYTWTSTDSVCDWYGVICNDDGIIQSLSMFGFDMTGNTSNLG